MAETVRFAEDPKTTVIKLEENFRSRVEICTAANLLIGNNRNRVAKYTLSIRGPGGNITVLEPAETEGEEIGIVARRIRQIQGFGAYEWNSIAVLARTNDLANAFRKTLKASGIPVVDREVSTLPQDWNLARSFVELVADPDNDALAFFHLIALYEKKGANPKEAREAAHAARRAAAMAGKSINRANLGIGKITQPSSAVAALPKEVSREARAILVDKLRELPPGATPLDFALSLAEVREFEQESGEGVKCMAVHKAKGAEFDVVFLVGFEDESWPDKRDNIEESRRLAFVAVTRARDQLYITSCKSRTTKWGQVVARTPSRFLAEMQGGAT